MTTYRTADGDMLDAICARHYTDVPLDQAVNVVLAANKGLARLGAVLPEDVVITLPEIAAVEIKPTIQLWED
ncbi:hypothetical protein AB835_11615 [Candidatus Endobugula sertula]|uniref:Phage tail protein n=1 Tax=Candidatus Endobugula sertula TaxID=62101 RepID=A0A1D2QMU5_9GAMM|nr:hypothetical protein AB835_11615 [Candidatus Endobugula sertula]